MSFIDGGMTFAGSIAAGEGARYQAQGRTSYVLAGLGGGELGRLVAGAPRAPVLATATLGVDVAGTSGLALFGAVSGESGDADHRAAAHSGVRLAF